MPRLGDLIRKNLERQLADTDEHIANLIAELARAQTHRDNVEATLDLHNKLDTGRVLEAECLECHRVFDLTDEADADEWLHGHDCEAADPPPSITIGEHHFDPQEDRPE